MTAAEQGAIPFDHPPSRPSLRLICIRLWSVARVSDFDSFVVPRRCIMGKKVLNGRHGHQSRPLGGLFTPPLFPAPRLAEVLKSFHIWVEVRSHTKKGGAKSGDFPTSMVVWWQIGRESGSLLLILSFPSARVRKLRVVHLQYALPSF